MYITFLLWIEQFPNMNVHYVIHFQVPHHHKHTATDNKLSPGVVPSLPCDLRQLVLDSHYSCEDRVCMIAGDLTTIPFLVPYQYHIITVIAATTVISSCAHVLIMKFFNQSILIFSNCASILPGDSVAAIMLWSMLVCYCMYSSLLSHGSITLYACPATVIWFGL